MYIKEVQKILKDVENDTQNMLLKLNKIKSTGTFTAGQSKSLTDLRSGIRGLQAIQIGEAMNEFEIGCKQEFEK